jgi:hypothetical protein
LGLVIVTQGLASHLSVSSDTRAFEGKIELEIFASPSLFFIMTPGGKHGRIMSSCGQISPNKKQMININTIQ